MKDFLVKRITGWLIKKQIISQEDRELYEYAVFSMFITMLPLLLAIIVGALGGNIKGYILVIIPFFILRKYSGGYHAKHASVCFLESLLLLVITVKVADSRFSIYAIIIIAVISIVSLVINSPIDSENRRLDEYEINICKRVVRVIVFALLIICTILYYMKCENNLRYVLCGIILTAVMQIPEIIKINKLFMRKVSFQNWIYNIKK